jgi:hypothetical protein
MKAQYNNGIELLELTVLKDNKDGTLELGNAKGELKVGLCPAPAKGASSPSKPAKGASDASDDTDAAAAAVKGKGN